MRERDSQKLPIGYSRARQGMALGVSRILPREQRIKRYRQACPGGKLMRNAC